MITANINIGEGSFVHETASINNVTIGSNVKIAKRCSIFGAPGQPVLVGSGTYIGMNSVLNGFAASLTVGENCSIAQNVNIMTDSGPNASERLQRIFPIEKGAVTVGAHCWIGASSILMPGVSLGRFCVVAANSYVNTSFGDYLVIGGVPAKVIRKLTEEEIHEVEK